MRTFDLKPSFALILIDFITLGYQNCAPAKYSTVMASSSATEDVDSAGGFSQSPDTSQPTDPTSSSPDNHQSCSTDGLCDDDSDHSSEDPEYDELDRHHADYSRVYHRIMSATFENVRMKDPVFARERLITLDESEDPESCQLYRSVTKQAETKQSSKEIKMKFCSGYLIARSIREKVGSCEPAEVELKSHSNRRVTIQRRLVLDENCLCHYDREVVYNSSGHMKSGLTERVHIRKRFARIDACAEHFPEYQTN